MVRLAGGEDRLMADLRRSVDEKDWQWTCQLADSIIALSSANVNEARRMKATALRALGEEQTNPPARNYYLSSSIELEKGDAVKIK